MYDIITFGSATLDVFMKSKKLKVVESEEFKTKQGLCVPLGSKLHMEEVVLAMGGCGTNSAVTFGRQGLKTAYFGQIGKDMGGQKVKEELSENNVSLDLLKETDKYPTALSVILSAPGIGRSILERYGACHELTETSIPFDKLQSRWFYISSLSAKSHDMLVPLVNFAKENKIKIASNPGGSMKTSKHTEILKSALDKIDILILNQEECARLTGEDFKDEEKILAKLNQWIKGIAVMTKGPEGVVVSDSKKMYRAGIPESDLVDRTGAGDAFGSGFVAGWMAKQDIAHAIQLGTANATAVLQKMGAAQGLLKKGEWGSWEKVKVNELRES